MVASSIANRCWNGSVSKKPVSNWTPVCATRNSWSRLDQFRSRRCASVSSRSVSHFLWASGCSMSATRQFLQPPRSLWRDRRHSPLCVAQHCDAGPKGLRRLDQCQPRNRGPVGKETPATALHCWIDEQPVFVDHLG